MQALHIRTQTTKTQTFEWKKKVFGMESDAFNVGHCSISIRLVLMCN